jgi:hypothetical protein
MIASVVTGRSQDGAGGCEGQAARGREEAGFDRADRELAERWTEDLFSF